MEETHNVMLKLPKEIFDKLTYLKKNHGVSKQFVVKECLLTNQSMYDLIDKYKNF